MAGTDFQAPRLNVVIHASTCDFLDAFSIGIVLDIVEDLQLPIDLFDNGSDFIVRLPLAEQQSVDVKKGGPLGPVSPKRRILIVDDNRDAANSLCVLLKFLGAEVTGAYDGATALDLVTVCLPTVVILDLGMPGLNGYEVAKRISNDHRFCDSTLIALTGWGQGEDRLRAQQAGFDHHLVKPVDLEALQTLLSSLGCGSGLPSATSVFSSVQN